MRRLFALFCAVSIAVFCITGSAPAKDKTVTFVDFSWSSVQMHNRIAGFVLEHGYGYKPNYIFAESVPGLTGLARGDIDVAMEIWIDNVLDWYNKAVGKDKKSSTLVLFFLTRLRDGTCPPLSSKATKRGASNLWLRI